MDEDLRDMWIELQKLKSGPFESKAAVGDARSRAKVLSQSFKELLGRASGIDVLLFISWLVADMRDLAVAAAREKGNDWRRTSRLLGEADALDDVDKLLEGILFCGDDYA